MQISNSVVRNAVAAYNADGSASMRWFDMYLNNKGEKWRLLADGKHVKARQAFERWKKAVDAMGPKVKADSAREARDFEAMLKEVEQWWNQSQFGRSLVQWRDSKFIEKVQGMMGRFAGVVPSSVKDYYQDARDNANKPKMVKRQTRSFDDDEYLE